MCFGQSNPVPSYDGTILIGKKVMHYPAMSLISETTEDEKSHYLVVGQAVFVTILWSSSWVIIKFGLQEIPPLTFSSLRYSIASMILLCVIYLRPELRKSARQQNRKWWFSLVVYGIIFVTITQGAQFLGLSLLPAVTVSMLLNLTPIVVLVMGILLLREVPTKKQIGWILLGVSGALLYFWPVVLPATQMIGVIIVIFGVIANALSSIIGRSINRTSTTPPVVVTGLSMGFGSILLLFLSFLLEGYTQLSLLSWFLVLWLSVVNTAIAFTIWNKAMQSLRAVDISILNSTMLPQIVVLSMIFLGEFPDLMDWIGLLIVVCSVLFLQINQARKKQSQFME
ncbi:MAG: EamA family transporter [Candidatus Lokiarchaeota archaeon]|nr:EamA family transporter [Candidatus Lokiarchaeota archaeon]